MNSNEIKLSIITINLNNKNGLAKTLKSVFEQKDKEFEYIVIDGASTDRSTDLLNINNSKIDMWVSEKDSGVYEAMNKGIKLAKGEYLLFLNSGDILHNVDTLKNVIPQLTGENVIYGNLELEKKNGKEVIEFSSSLTFKNFVGDATAIGHPSTFIKRELFEKYGMYDTSYRIISDWAFFIFVIIRENVSTKKINDIISIFDLEGMSTNPLNYEKILIEKNHFLSTHFPRFIKDYEEMIETENILNRIRSAKGFKLLKKLGIKKFQ